MADILPIQQTQRIPDRHRETIIVLSGREIRVENHQTYAILTLDEKQYILRTTPKGKLVLL